MDASAFSELNRLSVLWRRKWVVVATVLVVVAVTELVSRSLTPVYETTATLIIAQPGRQLTFDTAQANEEEARSYADILLSPNFASQVAATVGGTQASILSSVSIESVPNTALMRITADSPRPRQAQRIANTYANVFVNYAPRLSPQTKATVTLADAAPLPTSAIRPKPTLYSLAAALLGLMAGIGLAFLRERLDIRLRSVEDLSEHTGLPVLAAIPLRSTPRSIAAFDEAFRLLRTGLRYTGNAATATSVAITSWAEGEGKTTVASQLALATAASSTDTLIVDGDARRPGLQQALLPKTEKPLEPGLSDYLLGTALADQAIHSTETPGLEFMPPGRPVPNLSSMLETYRGRHALTGLGERNDSIIVDCPPLAVGADAPAIAAHVDGVVLVVDIRRATTRSVDNAIRRLKAVNASILGLVINRERERSVHPYYGYDDRGPGRDSAQGEVRRKVFARNGGASRRSTARSGGGSRENGA